MPRARSPNSIKAEELYISSNGKIELVEIAKQLNIPEGTVRSWKNRYKWDNKINATLQKNNRNVAKGKKQSQDKKGHASRSGNPCPVKKFTKRNKAAETHGFFSKFLPEETLEIMQEVETRDPLDLLWDQIVIQYTAIIRAQKIMYVTDKDEMIKELKKQKEYSKTHITKTGTQDDESSTEIEWNFQFAWDRQATFLKAQSRAMAELRNMISKYDELLKSNLATEEQKLRIEKLKLEIEKLKDGGSGDKVININLGIPGVDD